MFEARLAQGAVLKKVLDSVKDLVTDANFEADPQEGFKLQAMDSSHVSLVSLKLHANGFEHYRCDRPLTMGMNLMNMVRARERRIYLFFLRARRVARPRFARRASGGRRHDSTRARIFVVDAPRARETSRSFIVGNRWTRAWEGGRTRARDFYASRVARGRVDARARTTGRERTSEREDGD